MIVETIAIRSSKRQSEAANVTKRRRTYEPSPSPCLVLSPSPTTHPCAPRRPPLFLLRKTATRIYLKNKLPARDDINMDTLDFNAHEIAVAQVGAYT